MDKSTLDWVLNKHFKYDRLFGESTIKKYFVKYYVNNQDGSKFDFIWSFYQYQIIKTTETTSNIYLLNDILSKIYFQMVQFRRKYDNELANDLMQLSLDCSVKSYMPVDGFKMEISIISNACDCDYCESMNGKKFDGNDMLINKRYRAEKCTSSKGCRTIYSQVPARDKKGKLNRI
ncbi:hypothetical protein ACFQ5N_06395 [Lutibacter holmesii]|uniref:Uncharacterized protein n=1 Tax=Lutibacter holmesii TaxID=1137985 RepID=A0ABW3WP50_9FLAO